MKRQVLFLGIMLFALNVNAQEYFQQEVNYTIKVKLNDITNELFAYEEIEYTNNSPDNLDFIYFHLWANAYKNNSTALAKQKMYSSGKYQLFENKEQQGYIDSLDFKVNGKKIKLEYDAENIDICKIFLNKALKSGETITITTPFYVKLPKGTTSRLGHLKQSYKITQWYPKPAVYDKYGWHAMPYLDIGEFYSEYGSFDVSISLPKNYVVGASGNLVTESEKKWMEQKALETANRKEWDKTDIEVPKSSEEIKTIRFTENNIHDFAWFADKRYNVQKDTVTLPHSGSKVNTWALFTNDEYDLWSKANEYINDAIYYYSLWYGDYAYNNCTAILGRRGSRGNGMEYPGITAIGHSQNAFFLEMVIMHEVGHNWFYGMLGFNERRYPWMDEGINTFSEMRYFASKYPDNNNLYKLILDNKKMANFIGIEQFPYKQMQKIEYLISASLNIDQSASLTSTDYTDINYGFIVYAKVGRIFHYLHKYLGEEKFNEIMQEFFTTWKYKHPYPEDIKVAFEKYTDENLDWLFTDLLTTTKKLDYKIKRKKGKEILIKNKGDINSPISISGIKNDTIVFTKWYKGFENTKWLKIPKTETDIIAIDKMDYTLDLYDNNNYLKTNALFKKIEPIKLKPLGIIYNPAYNQIGFTPAFGANNYNKFMLGAFIHNGFIPMKKISYQLIPLYSFGTSNLAGSGKIKYNLLPQNSKIQSVQFNLSGLQYAYEAEKNSNFNKLQAEVKFTFRKPYARSKTINRLTINTVYASSMDDIINDNDLGYKFFHNINYSYENNRSINAFSTYLDIQASNNFVKTSLTANYKISYYRNNGLDIRVFGGTFLSKSENLSNTYSYSLSGSAGTSDYSYDNTFIGRFETYGNNNSNQLLSQQFVKDNGGFASYSPFGQTKDWIFTVNLTSSLPIKKNIPVKLFANAGFYGDDISYSLWPNADSFQYEAGAELSLINGFIKIYFPAVVSENINDYLNSSCNNYLQRIRFQINFHILKQGNIMSNF
ncbi:MAG: M1 family metallopeptidase [Bacteroidales bacterium]|jgi:hypothetical protein|nr:M1 family metallopeptidase [Bacteroidales bacterium]